MEQRTEDGGVGQAFPPAGSGDCQSPGRCKHPERPGHPSISADWKVRRTGRLESLPYNRPTTALHPPTTDDDRPPPPPTSFAPSASSLPTRAVISRADDDAPTTGPHGGAIFCRAGFPACQFRGLSVPRKVRISRAPRTSEHFGGLESPPNRQAGKPALRTPITAPTADGRVASAACTSMPSASSG